MAQAEFKNKYPFQIFIFSSVIFIGLVSAVAFFIYPSIMDIEETKSALQSTLSERKNVETKGIDYSSFASLRTDLIQDNSYESNIMRTISEEFYNEKVRNTTTDDFETYYTKLQVHISDQKKDKVQESRQLVINSVLPQYVDINDSTYEGLTEFKFVNYIETILYTFNLTVDGSLWISDVVPVESVTKKENAESVDATIFYIPLFLNLTGRKEDVLDFLYFMENVGGLNMENGVLTVYNDQKLNSKTSSGSSLPLWKNIYKNQIFDILTFRMQEYMDSDNSPTEKDFVSYVKQFQGREKSNIELGLKFYVRGLPNYKVKWYIKDLVKRQEDLNKKMNLKLKDLKKLNNGDSSEVLISINTIKSLGFDVAEVGKDIAKLNTWTWKQQTLNDSFKSALNLGDRLTQIEKTLNDESDKIEFYKNTKK